MKMEQVDGTVARHITQTSPPNAQESTALIILFWISMIDRTKMLRFASSKGKGGTPKARLSRSRHTPDSPARTPLTRRDTRCLAFALTCGTAIE